MANITLDERPDSRKWTVGVNGAFELRFNAAGDSNQERIMRNVTPQIPALYNGLELIDIHIDPIPETIDSVKGKGLWLVVATYQQKPLSDGAKYSFDTSGSTFHINQSLFTRDRYAIPGKTPTDYKGAINFDGDKVQGVDIVVPTFTFTETYEMLARLLTPGYKITLFNLTGVLNDNNFRGFTRGEVLFMGASGSLDATVGTYQVEFKFAASPELRNFKVGDITVGLKRGWDYIWVVYDKELDSNSKKLAVNPSEVYVERVYREGNFAALGIGTGLEPLIPR